MTDTLQSPPRPRSGDSPATPAGDVGAMTRLTHLVLLQFVTAEDRQTLGVILMQHHFHELLSERARPAGDQHNLF